jgi:hypothetical protein
MKEFRVGIIYAGLVEYTIKAQTREEAKELAKEGFDGCLPTSVDSRYDVHVYRNDEEDEDE